VGSCLYSQERSRKIKRTTSDCFFFQISSKNLYHCSRLVDQEERGQTYCNVDLSPMEQYSTKYYHEIDRCSLVFDRLSEDVDLLQMNFDKNPKNDLEQLTKLKIRCDIVVSRSGICHALLYWIFVGDSRGNTLDLFEQSDSCKASAFIFENPRMLAKDDCIGIETSLYHGNIIFNVYTGTK